MRNQFLKGHVAIIAGGGRGIGAATAHVLAQAGASVTVVARTSAEVESVAAEIASADGQALAVPADISDEAQVEAMVRRTIDAFGRIDFLINCAAVTEPLGQPAWEITPAEWQKSIDINLTGVFLLSRAVVGQMLRQGAGRLLIVSSNFSEVVLPRASAYCAARAGVNHFIRVLAAELDGTGVTANIVYPGVVETQGLQAFRSGLSGPNYTSDGTIRRRRTRDPSEPASLLLWLCSPATSHMTGQVVALGDEVVQRRLERFLNRQTASWPGT
ncbi:MAG TPA: SDR family oxidoreductase [Pyrinomonadaceae bacterium]|nr:SDR family oxidoreductase [Pyrinomonadaceae bacterium]